MMRIDCRNINSVDINSLDFREDLSLLFHTDRIWVVDTVTEGEKNPFKNK